MFSELSDLEVHQGGLRTLYMSPHTRAQTVMLAVGLKPISLHFLTELQHLFKPWKFHMDIC